MPCFFHRVGYKTRSYEKIKREYLWFSKFNHLDRLEKSDAFLSITDHIVLESRSYSLLKFSMRQGSDFCPDGFL